MTNEPPRNKRTNFMINWLNSMMKHWMISLRHSNITYLFCSIILLRLDPRKKEIWPIKFPTKWRDQKSLFLDSSKIFPFKVHPFLTDKNNSKGRVTADWDISTFLSMLDAFKHSKYLDLIISIYIEYKISFTYNWCK